MIYNKMKKFQLWQHVPSPNANNPQGYHLENGDDGIAAPAMWLTMRYTCHFQRTL